jgi:hypothetical protein
VPDWLAARPSRVLVGRVRVRGRPGQTITQQEIATSIEHALDARRQRIIVSQSSVNGAKWGAVATLAILRLFAIAFVHSGNRRGAVPAIDNAGRRWGCDPARAGEHDSGACSRTTGTEGSPPGRRRQCLRAGHCSAPVSAGFDARSGFRSLRSSWNAARSCNYTSPGELETFP